MAKNLSKMTIAELVELYNQHAPKPVKTFKNKETAVKRVRKVLPGNSKGNGGGRTPDFNFEVHPDGIGTAREGSLRADCVELLKSGATMDDVRKLVEKFDKAKGKTSETVERRAYELVRLMHTELGYGIKHNTETGVIKLVGRAAA